MNAKINFLIAFLVLSFFVDTSSGHGSDSKGHKGGKTLVLRLDGTGLLYSATVPDIDGDGEDDDAICFDLDLIDLKKNRVIGTATDCLSDITEVGDGLALVGTTFFNFDDGTIVSRGLTTVQPTTHGSPNSTHITGAISDGSNDILSGTDEFEDATGSVRLSGAVDMSSFDATEGSPITFDCIFVITLDEDD